MDLGTGCVFVPALGACLASRHHPPPPLHGPLLSASRKGQADAGTGAVQVSGLPGSPSPLVWGPRGLPPDVEASPSVPKTFLLPPPSTSPSPATQMLEK